MPLAQMWATAKDQLEDKLVQQVISFAGDGRLNDGNLTSKEFREFLAVVPSVQLQHYVDHSLTMKFDNSGFALQDIVNEIGRRLGFSVTNGRYRGVAGQLGFDGLWQSADGHAIVVEVKTTDAYRVDLNTIAAYRKGLVSQGKINEEASSILLVCGRQDTGDLEAQIRGSRHAWDVRMISVDSLLRLVRVKEDLDAPSVYRKIQTILIPYEFTKVDSIVDIVFSATEEVSQAEQVIEVEESVELLEEKESTTEAPKAQRVRFNDACAALVGEKIGLPLVKQSATVYSSPDKNTVIVCTVSKKYDELTNAGYWFAFHPHQRETLSSVASGCVVLGCGSQDLILLIPFGDFEPWLDGMNTTSRNDSSYWHVVVWDRDAKLTLRRRKGFEPIDVTPYKLPTDHS